MSKNRNPLVLCVALLAGLVATWTTHSVQAQANTGIVRVAPGGSNAAGCGSAAKPCQTLQFAVEQLISGSGASRAVNGEVRVAAGTYTEGNPAFENIIGIGLQGNLIIRGGYKTSDWNTSNPANATILDGQGSRRGILITVPEAQAAACTMRVENLTIANGRASAAEPSGGGILINNCNSVTVSNVTVRNSIAAGQSNTGNTGLSAGTGGGISARGTSSSLRAGLALQNVTLTNNQALGGDESGYPRGGLGAGGGLYGFNASISANGLTVTNNSANAGDAPAGNGEAEGQRADGLGGGITMILSTFNLNGVTVEQNTTRGGVAGGKGGLGLGGGLNIEQSSGSISDATVTNNDALGGTGGVGGSALGGGIFATDSSVTLSRSSLITNSTQGAPGGDSGGGGIWLTTGVTANNSLNATNIVVAKNRTSGSGGVVLGGGIGCGASQLTLNHGTLSGNTSSTGSAIALVGFSAGAPCGGSIRNTIVANHSGKPIYANAFAGNTSIDTTLVSSNGDVLLDNAFGRPVSENNTMSGDPDFVNANNDDFRIGGGSAAINAASGASPALDIEGQPRPVGNGADIGADEYQVGFAVSSGDTTIALSWEAPPGTNVTHYEIVYSGEPGADDANEGSSPLDVGADTSFTLTGLTKGAQYVLTIVAFDGQNEVARSTTRSVRTGVYLVYLPLVVR